MRLNRLIIAASTAIAASVVTSEAARAQVVTAAGGEVTLLTQKNVVDRMIVDDSLEVEMAQRAAAQTKNAAVRDLANQLVTDHRAHVEVLRKLAETPDIGRMAPAADSSSARAERALPADSTFDKAFVTAQVERHQRAIANLKKWRATATSPVLQKDIDGALTVAEQHLARAKDVAAQLK